jgi:ketosteroid isomerase-like protein
MSEENVAMVTRGYAHFRATGEFLEELTHPEFVWDMSTFRGWPEAKTYAGIEGAREFMDNWLSAWDDWQLGIEAIHDAGDNVVVIVRQRGRAKSTGLPVDMSFAQVWTVRDGKQIRMQAYDDPAEALRANGLAPKTRRSTE